MLRCLNFWSAIKHILWVGATFIHKLLIIQSDFYLPWCFDLYQRPSSEEACSVLLVPATVVMWRGKKSVVCVAALIPVHSMPSLLLDVYHFLDPSGAPVRLPVQDCWCPTTHQKNGTAFYEPGWGQLHTEPHIRLISCHVTSPPWQEPTEELNKLLLM